MSYILRCHSPPRASGFGLLEALVALVLLSGVGLSLLALVQQNLDTAQRLRGHYEEQSARRLVLDRLRAVNPMESPAGEFKGEGLRFVWATTLSGKVTAQVGYPAGIGKHDLALYDAKISVFRGNDDTPWFVEQLTMIGYRKVGARALPFGNG